MLLLVVLLAMGPSSPQLPPGVTCDQIREQVAHYGKIKSVAWAVSNGYSWTQIREAKKCLRS